MSLKKKINLFLLFIACISSNIFEARANQYSDLASKFLDEGLLIMENDNLTQKQKLQKVIDTYLDNMDLAWNAKMAMGRPYLKLTEKEKQEYIDEYSRYLAYIWLPKFRFNRKQGVRLTVLEKTQKINDTDENIKVIIEDPNANRYETIVRARITKDGKFKLLNMTIAGIDIANSYRSQFSSYIEQHNNDPRSVIEYLKKQNEIQKQKAIFKVNLKKNKNN